MFAKKTDFFYFYFSDLLFTRAHMSSSLDNPHPVVAFFGLFVLNSLLINEIRHRLAWAVSYLKTYQQIN